MATPFPFTSGQVLTAAQMNAITTLPINDQTASYTLVVGDVGKRVMMNVASANTVTVNNSIFAAGDTIFIANKGAGVSTITAGAGVTINPSGSLALAQYGGGTLVALSASTFTFFPAGVKNTLSVEFLLVAGGGGGGGNVNVGAGACGGGGAGGFITGTGIVGKSTYTVKVGAGGLGTAGGTGVMGTQSSFINSATGGGGGASRSESNSGNGGTGGSGGGAGVGSGGLGISGEGNNGGSRNTDSGGGGGGASAVGSNAPNSTTGGAGGAGTSNNYNGISTTYAGGGGGGGSGATTPGTGGAGGGGAGSGTGTATAGSANTGGGGGGGRTGGAGGSGKVIIRYLTADAAGLTITATGATSGTPTVDGANSYFEYNGSGTLVVA